MTTQDGGEWGNLPVQAGELPKLVFQVLWSAQIPAGGLPLNSRWLLPSPTNRQVLHVAWQGNIQATWTGNLAPYPQVLLLG